MEALHKGIWLGLLSPSRLEAATAAYYRSAGEYWLDNHNLRGLLDWEQACIETHFGYGGKLLVGAAGGGREILALSEHGFTVTGFDCVRELVHHCEDFLRRQGSSAHIEFAGPGQVPAGDELFDGAVIGWGGYMHIVGQKRRVAFLEAIAARLRPGGPLLLSFFTRTAESRRWAWIRRIALLVRRLRLNGEPVELGDTIAGSFDHHFTREEISAELVEGGFEVVLVETRPYGHAVARRRAS